MKIKNILIRSDSSSDIGTGHIMRDLVLAEQYPDAEISFAVQDLQGNINQKIQEKGYKIIVLQSNDVEELVGLVKKHAIEMVIIDHYGIDECFERVLKEETNVILLVLDDTYEKHYCDILLNHNFGADKEKYKNLVLESCDLKCGKKYSLIRKEFYLEKEKIVENKDTIFIAMGGADHSNINISILEVVHSISHMTIDLVTTTANKHLGRLKEFVENKGWIDLHVNSNDIARLINQSALSIITPSVMVNEVVFMGTPFVAIKTADNQMEIYKDLIRNNYLALDKFDAVALQKNIMKVLDNV